MLYQTVQAHLETWLARKWEDDDGYPVPPWVEREFRPFLRCGILALGFCRVRCGACGQDFLVALAWASYCTSCDRAVIGVVEHAPSVVVEGIGTDPEGASSASRFDRLRALAESFAELAERDQTARPQPLAAPLETIGAL